MTSSRKIDRIIMSYFSGRVFQINTLKLRVVNAVSNRFYHIRSIFSSKIPRIKIIIEFIPDQVDPYDHFPNGIHEVLQKKIKYFYHNISIWDIEVSIRRTSDGVLHEEPTIFKLHRQISRIHLTLNKLLDIHTKLNGKDKEEQEE